MQPNTPVYDQAIKGHVITFKASTPFFIELTSLQEHIDVSENAAFHALIREFLTSSARYFSRPLDYEQFQKRASHKWDYDGSILFRSAEGVRYNVEWQLQRVIFYTNRYETFWTAQAVQPVVVQAVNSPPSPVVKEVAAETIPFKAASAEERDRLKRSIRHARLRIALAQLRAERLAEKYYRRYGSWDGPPGDEDGDASDSDLSVDSVAAAAEGTVTAENIGSR